MKRALPRVWLITDRRQMTGDLVAAIRAAVNAVPPGTMGIILREKDLEGGALLKLARQIRSECGAPLVINGRLDIALACAADGVHLGGDAPEAALARQWAQAMLIGVSLHGEEQPPSVADYALLSPIFSTRSKPGIEPLGLERLRAAASRASVPLFALGGITAGNARDCVDAGAAGVAVREEVLLSPDPARAARRLVDALAF